MYFYHWIKMQILFSHMLVAIVGFCLATIGVLRFLCADSGWRTFYFREERTYETHYHIITHLIIAFRSRRLRRAGAYSFFRGMDSNKECDMHGIWFEGKILLMRRKTDAVHLRSRAFFWALDDNKGTHVHGNWRAGKILLMR